MPPDVSAVSASGVNRFSDSESDGEDGEVEPPHVEACAQQVLTQPPMQPLPPPAPVTCSPISTGTASPRPSDASTIGDSDAAQVPFGAEVWAAHSSRGGRRSHSGKARSSSAPQHSSHSRRTSLRQQHLAWQRQQEQQQQEHHQDQHRRPSFQFALSSSRGVTGKEGAGEISLSATVGSTFVFGGSGGGNGRKTTPPTHRRAASGPAAACSPSGSLDLSTPVLQQLGPGSVAASGRPDAGTAGGGSPNLPSPRPGAAA